MRRLTQRFLFVFAGFWLLLAVANWSACRWWEWYLCVWSGQPTHVLLHGWREGLGVEHHNYGEDHTPQRFTAWDHPPDDNNGTFAGYEIVPIMPGVFYYDGRWSGSLVFRNGFLLLLSTFFFCCGHMLNVRLRKAPSADQ